MKILISRTDSIGDVILTLPLCGWIKKHIPDARVYFLCQALTKPVIGRSKYIDEIITWPNQLPEMDVIIHVFPKKEIALAAKKAGIRTRIGTSHRIFHWWTCNELVNFTRRNSELHEAQLNFELLKGLKIDFKIPSLGEMPALSGWQPPRSKTSKYLSNEKFNLIFHIKSRGSAKEWAAKNYLELAKQLESDRFNIILTGTKAEQELINAEIPEIFTLANVTDTTGRLSLDGLIELIGQCDGLLACSTGPLHIAAISGIHCLGLYPSQRPMHAGRWGAIGSKSEFLEEDKPSQNVQLSISVNLVEDRIRSWID